MVPARVAQKRMTYDPMVYDVMRETATRLGGRLIAQARTTTDETQKQKLREESAQLEDEVLAVDIYSEHAVRAKTAELSARLQVQHE